MLSRRALRRIMLLVIVAVMIFSPKNILAQEHKLRSIEISVELMEDGSATIREVRDANLIEGTENYIVIGNLGDSEIIDFTVKENGIQYEKMDYWDIDLPREEKTHKSGIVDTGDGYELCWGIGEYGSHVYELEYTVTNFVKQFQDRQGVFWRFINDDTNIPPEIAKVIIKSNIEFNDSNSAIWAFGYEGEIVFDSGQIVARSSQALESYNYLTILVELEDGMFATTSELIDRPFDEIRDMALEGSDYELDYGNDDDSDNEWDYRPSGGNSGFSPFMIISLISSILVPGAFLIIGGLAISKTLANSPRSYRKKYKGEYYRDYPYEGPFEEAYHILSHMGTSKMENLMTAFILKWIHSGDIAIEKLERGLFFKKEDTGLKFINKYKEKISVEGQLYNMMMEAAGTNWILENNEFTKWARKNYRKLETWDEEAKKNSKKVLETQGFLDVEEKRFLFFKYPQASNTAKGDFLEEKVYKFMNYLYDFSLLNEHEAINVGIWDDLMIWAGLLGITEAVEKEFKKLYPNYEAESAYRGSAIYMAHSFSRSASNAAVSRSSGGGGFSSSGGGGGGSFGGGSGGGTR